MKLLNKIIMGSVLVTFALACEDGIDPISSVDPGPDEAPPTVTITFPFEGAQIRVREDVAPVQIKFQATDDIEIGNVVVNLDGQKIGEFSGFKDYRKAIQEFQYANLTNGEHVLSVTATDLTGKATTADVNFMKVPPYEPKYPGEILYMPFDGDIFEQLSITEGTAGGSPTFVDGLAGKAISFNAANASYVTFPGDVMAGVSSFSLSFFVNPDFVDANGNGEIDGILGLVNLSNTTGFWGNIDWFIENGTKPSATKMVVHVTNDDSEVWINELNSLTGFFGNWSHHVVTYDAETHTFKYYINGTLRLTKAATWTDDLAFKNIGPIVFGAVHFMTNPSSTSGSGAQPWASYLTGEMDEVRIFDRAITPEEVVQIYDDVM